MAPAVTPFSDPAVDVLMDRYFEADEDARLLYPGTNDEITKKLQDWIPRRIESNKQVMAGREESHRYNDAMFEWSRKGHSGPPPTTIADIVRRVDLMHSRDADSSRDSMRAIYLLETLRQRGITWPELWYQPKTDGGVCSYLGMIDPNFKAIEILTTLEAKEYEDRLRRKLAEQFPDKVNADGTLVDQDQPSKTKGQARAEQRKKARAKAREEASDAQQSDDAGSSTRDWPSDGLDRHLAILKEAMMDDKYSGVLFDDQNTVSVSGLNEADAKARVKRFVENAFGTGTAVEHVLGPMLNIRICNVAMQGVDERSQASREEGGVNDANGVVITHLGYHPAAARGPEKIMMALTLAASPLYGR